MWKIYNYEDSRRRHSYVNKQKKNVLNIYNNAQLNILFNGI